MITEQWLEFLAPALSGGEEITRSFKKQKRNFLQRKRAQGGSKSPLEKGQRSRIDCFDLEIFRRTAQNLDRNGQQRKKAL